LHHQDWTTVIFKTKKTRDGEQQQAARVQAHRAAAGAATESTTSSKPAWKIERMAEDGFRIPRVSREDAQRIIAARIDKKLTQASLAAALRMQARDIQEIESGKAVEDRKVIAKIFAHLGVKR
jgi:ribosome-binding protein aMBF1 (putative translation factor)